MHWLKHKCGGGGGDCIGKGGSCNSYRSVIVKAVVVVGVVLVLLVVVVLVVAVVMVASVVVR